MSCPMSASFSIPEQDFSLEEAQRESYDSSTNDNAGRTMKPAWNKPLSGAVEAGSIMGGAVAWPSLSECTRPTLKSCDSSKLIPNGSSFSQGSIISQLPEKQANSKASTQSNANPINPVRQRSMKHRGSNSPGGGSTTQNGFSRAPPPLPPPLPVLEMPYGNHVQDALMPPVRGTRHVGVGPSQPHATNDHPSPRNPSRKGNFGGRPRGNGSYRNFGGRHNQDRRDFHLTPQFLPPGVFMPPQPPGSGPFLTHPPLRPFAAPMGFDMAAPFVYVPTMPPESFRGVPMFTPPPPPPLFFSDVDQNLPASSLVKQIEYYFSDDNLVKDDFLKSKMDVDGWVPIDLIANFPRVRMLTSNIQFILDCLNSSVLVEVQNEKVRKRDDWQKWIPMSGRFAADSGTYTPGALMENGITTSLQKVD